MTQVNIKLTPRREAIPVMKQVLEHATHQNIYKQERELKVLTTVYYERS